MVVLILFQILDFISNMNDNFYEASFEVYYISVRQKLVILGFSHKIFFILTLVISKTSWGQTMSFSDFTEVSNFSWSIQKPLSLSNHFWTLPASLTDQKAHIA